MKMVRRDAIVGVVALALGAGAAHESSKLPLGIVQSPGPGFFPWWIGALTVLLALFLLGQALRSPFDAAAEPPGRTGKVLELLIVLAAYVFLLEQVGYPFCTFLLVLFMLRAIDPQRWPLALGVAALTSAGSYIVFAVWLGVPLPRGPL
jgi:putative tricarboxylic transport membrane protein